MVTEIGSMYWTPADLPTPVGRLFKWLTLVLFAYVLATFFAKPD